VDSKQRFLTKIFTQLPVAQVSKEKSDQGRLVTLYQFVKRSFVSLLQTHHRSVIVIEHECAF